VISEPLLLREYGGARTVRLTDGQADALTTLEVASVSRGPRPGTWKVSAARRVGAARLGTGAYAIEVRIEPKLPIRRLLFLVGYARQGTLWRQEEVDAGQHPDLLPAVAHAFVRAAERALAGGILQGYRRVDEALPVVRGRFREADQLRRRYGMPLPVEVSYDDYGIDIPENQLLAGAADRLLRVPGVSAEVTRRLRHVAARLVDVPRPVRGTLLPRWQPSRLNVRYHTALGLAELALHNASYELDDGHRVRVDGLLLDMWRIYEDFVTRALTDALRPFGGRCTLQDTRHHLDRARHVQLRPDLVYYRLSNTGSAPAGVVDAKYKREKTRGGHNPDLYQMLAYCTVLGLDKGHLIYAKGTERPAIHHLNGRHPITVHQHSLDLDQSPQQLLAQIATIATTLQPTQPPVGAVR
jgi:5-methylcytosine-specific restriction enzyme subunit McrC